MNSSVKHTDVEIKAPRPEILAPAGGRKSFLAAIAAGADAIYCGLKEFSARMAAENFTVEELVPLTRLAHDHQTKVYIAINSLIKPDELDSAGKLLDQVSRFVNPDALIISDLAMIPLAGQVGFQGELHLSTLANVSFSSALNLAAKFPGIRRVVLPRELDIDEIKEIAESCPKGLSIEVFVHGALCYGVSGRCYWSSFLGGKSGLRGRCVQPCRRIYAQKGERRRFFSCNDLWMDVLTKVLVNIPQLSGIKIEGRKKGPHYVYYTVSAYRLFRDHADDPKMKKTALSFLEYALGRKGTHYNILPQRPQNPIDVSVQTGSGMMVGKVTGGLRPYIVPRLELLPHDFLRIGYEDDDWHATCSVNNYISRKTKFFLPKAGKTAPPAGTPVFLIDRRDSELNQQMTLLSNELEQFASKEIGVSKFRAIVPDKAYLKSPGIEVTVYRDFSGGKLESQKCVGLWLSLDMRHPEIISSDRHWYWLPPVIWPQDEKRWKSVIDQALKKQCRNFVLNAPWQIAFFPIGKKLNLWAGSFCNITNPLAIEILKSIGFSGVIVSPELGEKDFRLLAARSVLPLGIMISGIWPLSISRTVSDQVRLGIPFTSPKQEQAWVSQHGKDFWIFPNWEIDLTDRRDVLEKIGYKMFVHLQESLPKQVYLKKRPGVWNWNIGLK